jgi:hypothetical protein
MLPPRRKRTPMSSKFRKVLFAAPLLTALAAVAALALPASEVQGDVTVPTVDATADVGADVVIGGGEELSLVALNCTYYNNAAHTTVVGQFGYDCCNNPVHWGRKSAYSSCGGCFVCFPPPQ